jgi:hypothetical protein
MMEDKNVHATRTLEKVQCIVYDFDAEEETQNVWGRGKHNNIVLIPEAES